MSQYHLFFRDRIQLNSILIVFCFVSVLALGSQSAASYSTYLLALAMFATVRRWNDVFSIHLFWIFVVLLIYLGVSSFWSLNYQNRGLISVSSRILLVILFLVAVAECQLRGQLQLWLGRALAIAGSLAAAAALLLFFVEKPEDGRIVGLGQLDNQVVAALVFGAVLIFLLDACIRETSQGWRTCAAVGIVVISITVFLSDSRNAWVSVLIGVGVFTLSHITNDRQRFLAGFIALTLILGVVIAVLLMNDLTREFVLPRGLSYRPAIWIATIEKAAEHSVWFGAGILTENDVVIDAIRFQHPHSMYLSVYFQGGAVGVVLFGAVIVGMLRTLYQNYHMRDAKLGLGILGIALPAYALDGHELLDKVGWNWFLFWMPAAIALGIAWSGKLKEL